MENYPPYTITDKMLNYVSDIMKKIGEANYFESLNRYPELRRKSRIRSIHSSLAIENNQLSLFQVEDVIMDAQGKINLSVIDKYADLMAKSDMTGVFVCGTTGESQSLTTHERKNILEQWVKSSNGRFKENSWYSNIFN